MRTFVLSTLVAAAFGCADDPTLDQHAAELAGVPTTARPEIGRVQRDDGSRCLGTLIAPRVVLTSASCVTDGYWRNTVTTPPPGTAYVFTDKNGTLRSYAIDRVRGFYGDWYERILDDEFGTSVALAHLTTAVPINQATPATLALALPALGASVRVYGWDAYETYGKQLRDFTFTGGVSPFTWDFVDRGGPATDASGALWGTVHRYVNYGGFAEHLFTSLPFYRRQLEGVRLAWDGPDEVGFTRAGTTYRTELPGSATACRALCEADRRCHAFTFYPSGGYCDLQDAAAEAAPSPSGTTVAGLPARFELGVDRWGDDLESQTQPRADACAAACGRHGGCRTWTWNSATKLCWLKGANPAAPTACATCTSGVISRQWESMVDRPGHDYLTLTANDAAACSDLCRRDARCQAFTWVAFTKHCWLKDAAATPRPTTTAMTSGVRRGLEVDTNRSGSDYRSFANSDLDPNVCQAACAAEPNCSAWTYDGRSDRSKRCHLKNGVPAPSAMPGAVSGVKGLEFL